MKRFLLATIIVPLLVAPASSKTAQMAGRGVTSYSAAASRGQFAPSYIETRVRNAYGMVTGSRFNRDRNSPEATGGGSLGYNRKLLEY